MAFPTTRLRRLRSSASLRRLVRETRLSPDSLVYPIFVEPGRNIRRPIASMPGQYRYSIDQLPRLAKEIHASGVSSVILFGVPKRKDEIGSEAYSKTGTVQVAVRELKSAAPDLCVITDVCLCQYTSHGHCGKVRKTSRGYEVVNDPTLELLGRTAVSHAEAGADMVAPSDMMDGRIGAIRKVLDGCGLENTPILAYSAKYASAFYGPFRDAAESKPHFGDRKSYQMDPPNVRQAMREIEMDIREGADIVMVKPALAYLDVIRAAREEFDVPLAAYNVSGEYSMLMAAAQKGWMDRDAGMLEMLTSIRRAGADIILTYFALDAARRLGG